MPRVSVCVLGIPSTIDMVFGWTSTLWLEPEYAIGIPGGLAGIGIRIRRFSASPLIIDRAHPLVLAADVRLGSTAGVSMIT